MTLFSWVLWYAFSMCQQNAATWHPATHDAAVLENEMEICSGNALLSVVKVGVSNQVVRFVKFPKKCVQALCTMILRVKTERLAFFPMCVSHGRHGVESFMCII